jgi:putative membrane protein
MTGLLIRWAASALSLLVVAFFLPGFHVSGVWAALKAAAVVGLVNGTLGLALKVVTFPLTMVTLGLFWLVINALMLELAAWLVDGFAIDGFWWAFFGAILLSFTNMMLKGLIEEKKQ